jgi:hypothetical protein
LIFNRIRVPLTHLFDLQTRLVQIPRHFLGSEQGGINRHPLPKPILGVDFAYASMQGEEQRCVSLEDTGACLEHLWHLRALQVDETVKRHDPCENDAGGTSRPRISPL